MGDAGVLHVDNFLKLKEKVLFILAAMNCVMHRGFLQMYTIKQ